MILISHRGNINNVLPELENSPSYIDAAIARGYDVEIDVRLVLGKIFLGHDNPDYEVSLDWLLNRKKFLWVHTKNFEALSFLIDKDLRTFYHVREAHTIINNCNLIWSHNLSQADKKSIIPLISKADTDTFFEEDFSDVAGICSDFITLIG